MFFLPHSSSAQGAALARRCLPLPPHASHRTHRRLLFCITGTIACAGLMGPAFLLVQVSAIPIDTFRHDFI